MGVEPSQRRDHVPYRLRFVAAFLFVTVLTILQLTRQAGVPATDSVWAEDGRVFLSDALGTDSPWLLFRPLAGYMHLAPRVVAWVAAALPLDMAALVFSIGPALIVSWLGLYSIVAFRELLPPLWARVAFGAFVALLPATATESANNAANLHFYLVFGAFAALVHRPRSWGGAIVGSLIAFVAATSDPRTALLLPVGVWAAVRGNRFQQTIALAFVAGLMLQGLVVLASFGFGIDPTTALSAPQFGRSSLSHIPVLYGVRVVAHLIVGDRWIATAWQSLGPWLALAGLAGLAAVVLGAVIRPSVRRPGLLVVGYSVIVFAFQAMAWGTSELWPYGGGWAGNSRYLVFPQLLLVLGTAMVLEDLARERGAPWRWILVGFFVVLSVVAALHLRVEIVRSAGPRWSTELARARAACERSDGQGTIQTAPPWTPDWAVRATCSAITEERVRRAAGTGGSRSRPILPHLVAPGANRSLGSRPDEALRGGSRP
jgi:hypothetical protein